MLSIVDHWLAGADRRPSPNIGGRLADPSLVVMHETAGPLTQGAAAHWLCAPEARASAHLVIERDGSIAQLVPFDRVAWHAGASRWRGRAGCNAFSIGIELVGPGLMTRLGPGRARTWWGAVITDPDVEDGVLPSGQRGTWLPFAEAQLAATRAAVMTIGRVYGITQIAAHYEVSPGRKTDPGPLFPLPQFRGLLLGRDSDDAAGALISTGVPYRRWPAVSSPILGAFPAAISLPVLREAVIDGQRWVQVPRRDGRDDAQVWVAHADIQEI